MKKELIKIELSKIEGGKSAKLGRVTREPLDGDIIETARGFYVERKPGKVAEVLGLNSLFTVEVSAEVKAWAKMVKNLAESCSRSEIELFDNGAAVMSYTDDYEFGMENAAGTPSGLSVNIEVLRHAEKVMGCFTNFDAVEVLVNWDGDKAYLKVGETAEGGAIYCMWSSPCTVRDTRDFSGPSEAVEAPKAENFDAEGENARGGAEVLPEPETAPEAKETGKDETPANLERVTGERLTHAELMAHPEKCPELGDLVEVSDSPVKSQNGFFVITSWNSKKYFGNSSFYGLGVKKNDWDDTTKNNLYWPPRNTSGTRAAHEANATHTPKMRVLGPVSLAGLDFVRAEYENAKEWQRRDDREASRAYVDECREALARMEEENPALFKATRKADAENGTGLKIAKNGLYVREGGKWELYRAFYSVDGRHDGRPCVTVYARSYGDLPKGFGLEIVNDSDPYTDYVTGDRATVYEDHPLYKKFREAAAGAKHYHLTAEDVENVREYVENRMEAARKAREAEEEALRAKYEEQERHAREIIAEYVKLFPGDAYHPHVIVEWSELGAMNDRGRQHGDSTIFSVEAFEAITGDLDKYFEGDSGYNKLKFTFYAGGGSEFTDRCDLGDGGGSYGKRMRYALAHAGERASNGEVMLDGGAVVGLDEYEANARRYLENLAVTWDEIGAA